MYHAEIMENNINVRAWVSESIETDSVFQKAIIYKFHETSAIIMTVCLVLL